MDSHTNSTRKMTSLARRIHWWMIGRKLGIYFAMDILMALCFLAGWMADQIWTRGGTLAQWKTWREVDITGGTTPESIMFRFPDSSSTMVSVPCLIPLMVISAVIGSIFCLQLLSLMFTYFAEDKRIRQILWPINEMALKADEISRSSFDENKYQILENALNDLTPEEAETEQLSLNDKDLQGVEAAMNNLLLRIHDAHKQQSRFVNDASHELRTPIAVIQGYVNMLDRWGKEDPKVLEESITAIRNESDHMNHLVEQLLFLARGDSGKLALKLEDVNLRDMMKEIYEESILIDEAHQYRFAEPEEPLPMKADAGLLKQAVRILVDNAAKYTKQGDEIHLDAGRLPDGHLYLQVEDNGIGMAEADVEHMFERFYRSDEARSYQGTGLGLSIAKWIVDRHGGHFEILSRTDLGTRIRIIF